MRHIKIFHTDNHGNVETIMSDHNTKTIFFKNTDRLLIYLTFIQKKITRIANVEYLYAVS